jgi:hypothetical protein
MTRRGHISKHWNPQPEARDQRQLRRPIGPQRRPAQSLLQHTLHRLNNLHRNLAPPLHPRQVGRPYPHPAAAAATVYSPAATTS